MASKVVEGERCMRGSNEVMCFSEKEGLYGRDHNVEGDAAEGPVVCVGREDVLLALSEVKP